MCEEELFTTKLRQVSKSIHNKSDALVNLKLGICASDPSVWAEGLLVFYPIFKFLEQYLENHKDSLIGELIIDTDMFRTTSFEDDLKFYLGHEFDIQFKRPEVEAYIRHLNDLERKDPYLVMAYVYHLYMGLFSGGQILAAKRKIGFNREVSREDGNSLMDFGVISISKLKRGMKSAMNRIAQDLDESTRDAICSEGIRVFELNNTIIKTVKGVDEIFYAKLKMWFIYFFLLLIAIISMYYYFMF